MLTFGGCTVKMSLSKSPKKDEQHIYQCVRNILLDACAHAVYIVTKKKVNLKLPYSISLHWFGFRTNVFVLPVKHS